MQRYYYFLRKKDVVYYIVITIARRSGTTNLYKLGVLSDLELRSITGHESQKNFEDYIRIGISEQAQRVGDKIKAAREAMKKQVDK